MARPVPLRSGAIWTVVLSLLVSLCAGHSAGVARNLLRNTTVGPAISDRGAGVTSLSSQDATGAGHMWPPATLAPHSHLLLPRDVPIQPQMPEGLTLSAAHPAAFLASIQSEQSEDMRFAGEFRDTLNTQPVIPSRLPDDWTFVADTIGPLSPEDEFSAGASRRVTLGDTGQLLAQAQPSGEAPGEAAREADVAKQLANPISSLISVPFQSNIHFGIGPTQGGFQYLLNIQPVYPASMNEAWNFVTRMILPIVYQNQIFPGAGSQFGLGDTTFQFFFSPKAPTKGGIIWGVGPTLFVPTGTDPLLSARTWGAGVDGVVLAQLPQTGGLLTIGILGSQTWSFAGPATINSLFLQPFVAFTFPNTVTITLQSQAVYNWNQGQWTVPIIAGVSKIYKFGDQLTSLGAGVKYFPVSPVGAPTWGLQFTVTLLFPAR